MKSRAVYEMKERAVYRLYDLRGRLMYVGCSMDPRHRLYCDHINKPWGPRIARMEVDWYADRPTALKVERALIEEHEPPHNTNYTRRVDDDIRITGRWTDGSDLEQRLIDAVNAIGSTP